MDEKYYQDEMAKGFEEYKEQKAKNISIKQRMLEQGYDPADPRFSMLDNALAECKVTLMDTMHVMGYSQSDIEAVWGDIDNNNLLQ